MFNVTANGATIPAIGFGTFRMKGNDVARMVRSALSIGYRHIDTAQIYENEAEVGEGLAASGIPRSDVFLTTKVWVANFPPDKFLSSVDESLRKLRTDYVDLLLLHWPNGDVPLAEQIAALNEARVRGKVRHVGLSNYTTTLLAAALSLSPAPIVTNQVEYHPYLDQSVILKPVRAAGLALTAYYAMADGKVIGDPVLQRIGARHGKSEAQVVLRWLIQQDGVIALSKTVSEERARANFDIFDFELAPEEMSEIFALARPDGRLLSPPKYAPVWDEAA
jgi:diketogulonate reductase-like aldo/keto reductase